MVGRTRWEDTVTPARGEIWWAESEDVRRPVMVVTRDAAIPVLGAILVAPVTRTVRGIPTEIPLGRAEGLPRPCAASFDNLRPVRKAWLTRRMGALGLRSNEICDALAALSDC